MEEDIIHLKYRYYELLFRVCIAFYQISQDKIDRSTNLSNYYPQKWMILNERQVLPNAFPCPERETCTDFPRNKECSLWATYGCQAIHTKAWRLLLNPYLSETSTFAKQFLVKACIQSTTGNIVMHHWKIKQERSVGLLDCETSQQP